MTDPKEEDIKKNLEENVIRDILTNDFVQSFSNEILSNPRYVIDESGKKEKLYSLNQMTEMFRAGFTSMTKDAFDQKVFEKNSSRSQCPFRIMKQMAVGSIKYFPYTKWTAARTAASALKRQFGCVFVVTKDADHNEIGEIKVKRIK